ncbi:hypothetical protein IMG5_199190 [Ichthyophthirius multifiliis]|uniref:Transmembrane protein n=1 Tax=Ichthyophthirius multifiliis TaxID=5932 RepID=G0R5I0_ICHMU|nr:hypothetical protein IMG5_199190 [Ichthyophthirius multifiliis]EGR27240.1 hypothetical protein IMG5_199190 [Ichthyophthirius multifiliis]|eukprot:XP_004024124.1 hypothetical protein IMG5_199190 [Ichthyophthirius multifiliis]
MKNIKQLQILNIKLITNYSLYKNQLIQIFQIKYIIYLCVQYIFNKIICFGFYNNFSFDIYIIQQILIINRLSNQKIDLLIKYQIFLYQLIKYQFKLQQIYQYFLQIIKKKINQIKQRKKVKQLTMGKQQTQKTINLLLQRDLYPASSSSNKITMKNLRNPIQIQRLLYQPP